MNAHEAAVLSRMKTPLVNKWMLAEIVDAEGGQSKAGRDQTVVTLAPVVNNFPQRDLSLRGYIQPRMEGDKPDVLAKVRKRGGPFIRAVDPEFPKFPKREGKGVYVVTSPLTIEEGPHKGRTFEEGEQIGYGEYNSIQIQMDTMVFNALESLPDHVADLKGLRIYIRPGRATYSEDWGVSQFIDGYAIEPPEGREVADDTELVDEEAQARILAELGLGGE